MQAGNALLRPTQEISLAAGGTIGRVTRYYRSLNHAPNKV